MNLLEMAQAATKVQKPNHSILIYGPPKTGKTRFVGTAAELPEIKRIWWFDGENGLDTLLHMGLSPEAMSKVTAFRIPDTRESPRFVETMLKAMTSKVPIKICHAHGKVGCVECKAPEQSTEFCLSKCTHDELVVIDSGSQLGDSALNLACLGKDVTYKPGYDEYGACGKYLSDILTVVQASVYTNVVIISHEMVVEEEVNGIKKDKILPLIGTRTYCSKVSKYFGTVVYTEIKMGKHTTGSSSTYKANHVTGSRLNISTEKSKEEGMKAILIEGGILK